ncbi:cytochrome c oxidase subunit I [Coralloluteibacterium thermophilus]|uniref:cytochrome-c oxidase n=1 Tax=Coralloluteibacterium thermophilum TaxID=2707049 RepID=A0ABV9NMD6_9GAMM
MSADKLPLPAEEARGQDVSLRRRLEAIWDNKPGLVGQLTAVNHTTVGLRFIVTGIAFLMLGGLLSMFMRLQLAWPGNTVLDHDTYHQFVTMHGTTMMFLFAVPIMEGFALYLIPKMIGARDVPFPRMTAFGYWCYLFGGLFLYSSFFFGEAPDAGWFMYTPLSGSTYTPGKSADFWLLGVTFAEIAAVSAAIELIVAILFCRAPGMSLQRMPLFAWYVLVTAFMIAFGFPPLIMASVLLEIERAFDFTFYEPALGGDPLLWQHLFWLFGHPEVYIIFLPAAGVVSTIIPTFSRRPAVGYTWVVLAIIATGFLSFGLWVHHMFTVGIPLLALSFFSAASMGVAIPMGIQVFSWIATLWTGRPQLRQPMRFMLGFFAIFVCGGLTGVMVALVPFDWQAHDTHFVVAHLHYVLIGGLLFPMFAGFYYWLPQVTGRMPSEGFSRMVFWLIFVSFNLLFLPMHFTGLLGMPRRAYTYSEDLGPWVQGLNLLSTAAGFALAVGFVAFVIDMLLMLRHGRRAEPDPWKAGSLEWAMPTPAPAYNFVSQPQVIGRNPLWDDSTVREQIEAGRGWLPFARDEARETLGTSLRTGEPEQVIRLSNATWLPLIAALILAVFFAGFLASWYWLSALCVAAFVGVLLRWLWTTGDPYAPAELDAGHGRVLPTHAHARNAPGWWGTALLLVVDSTLYASLVFAYFFLWLVNDAWPPPTADMPGLVLPGLSLLLVAAAGLLVGRAVRANGEGAAGRMQAALVLAALAGVAAIVLRTVPLGLALGAPQAHAYASVVWTLVGFEALHVLIAVLMAGFTLVRARHGLVTPARSLDLRVTALFWRYSVALWVVGSIVVHLFPEVS